MIPIIDEPTASSDLPSQHHSPTVFSTPQLGQIGKLFENREHFIKHAKQTASSFGFHLASRGSYPKKPRQDICFACTVGRNYKRPKKATEAIEVQPVQTPCPVAVTGKWQVNQDGSLLEGGKFEITQSSVTHNHPPLSPAPSPPSVSLPPQPRGLPLLGLAHLALSLPRPDTSLPISVTLSNFLQAHLQAPQAASSSLELPDCRNPNKAQTSHRLLTVPSTRLPSASASTSLLSAPPSSSPPTSPSTASLPLGLPAALPPMDLAAPYPRHLHPLSASADQDLAPDSLADNHASPPNLPQVGDFFQSWDEFRTYARRGAEARGFALSQSQSKGSSGTIVLRCSRFKDPGVAGQKMAENGCEVFFKVMKAKNGLDGFEVTQSYEHHNHAYGLHIPVASVSRPNHSHASVGPKRKKAKSSHPAPDQHQLYEPAGPRSMTAGLTPPGTAPKPFLFDPYTGKPLRSSNTPAPPAGSSDHTSPSPPSDAGPAVATHIPAVYPAGHGATYVAPTHYYNSGAPTLVAHGQPVVHTNELSGYQQQQQILLHQQHTHQAPTPSTRKRASPVKQPSISGAPTHHLNPLNVRFTPKAQNQIGDFLSALSPAMAAYGPHFVWLGIRSPVDLLEIEDTAGPAELECVFDELDTSGMGGTGEGLGQEEKDLVLRGLRRLRIVRHKAH